MKLCEVGAQPLIISTQRGGRQAQVDACQRGEGDVSSMWTS